MVLKSPGGPLDRLKAHVFFLADASGSMARHGKIQALNNSVREAIPHMRKVADQNPHAEVLVRAAWFAKGAGWHIAKPTPLDQFQWIDLTADGETDLGAAFWMVAEELKMPPMGKHGFPPVLILVTDGKPTDEAKAALAALLALPWGRKAIRVAIAIGQDADRKFLQEFIGDPEFKPLEANNPEDLKKQIRWAATTTLAAATSPATQSKGEAQSGTRLLPAPPPAAAPGDAHAAW